MSAAGTFVRNRVRFPSMSAAGTFVRNRVRFPSMSAAGTLLRNGSAAGMRNISAAGTLVRSRSAAGTLMRSRARLPSMSAAGTLLRGGALRSESRAENRSITSLLSESSLFSSGDRRYQILHISQLVNSDNKLVNSDKKRTFVIDALAQVRRLEKLGLPCNQKEEIMSSITKVLIDTLEKVNHSFSSLVDTDMNEEKLFLWFQKETEKSHIDSKRMHNEQQIMRTQLRNEINKFRHEVKAQTHELKAQLVAMKYDIIKYNMAVGLIYAAGLGILCIFM